MDELIRQLSHIGLSDKEAAVYIASLEIGPSVVQDIAKKAGVNRATTYVMIEMLAGRGLVSTFVKGKKRFFAAESPDRLASLLRLQKREIEEREKDIENVIPILNAMFNAEGVRPQVRYLEGRDGILSVMKTFQEIEGEWVEIVAMDDVSGFEELMAGHRAEHLEELKKRGAPHRVLAVMKEPNFNT